MVFRGTSFELIGNPNETLLEGFHELFQDWLSRFQTLPIGVLFGCAAGLPGDQLHDPDRRDRAMFADETLGRVGRLEYAVMPDERPDDSLLRLGVDGDHATVPQLPGGRTESGHGHALGEAR